MIDITKRLFELQDTTYKSFHGKLIPGVSDDKIIGVRSPQLRRLAKELSQYPEEAETFMGELPHRYNDENMLHAYLLERMNAPIEEVIARVEAFLPYVDNWAVCDVMSPKVFGKHSDYVQMKCKEWLKSEHVYTVRFGIVVLLGRFLDSEFDETIFGAINAITNEDYYVKMAVAWYYSFALIKQWEATLPLIENNVLEVWIHNKSIQKACESRRITAERKALLRTKYRRKGEGVRHEM